MTDFTPSPKKFRVWLNGQMFTPEREPKDPFLLPSTTLAGRKDGEEIAVLQSTGLPDADGREIFEGDIVRVRYPDDGSFVDQLLGPVEMRGGRWVYGDSGIGVSDSQVVRVAGNVYENPDLLD